jgi:cell division protein FtsB
MREFEKKRKIRKIIYSKFVILLLVLLLFILARGVWGVYLRSRTSSERESQSQETLQILESKKDSLSQEVEFLESELGIEGRLRSFYSLGREGEEVIFIIDETEELIIEEKPMGFMDKTMSWFRSINLLK